MSGLSQQIKDYVIGAGGALVGLTSKERLSDAPPSGDPSYLLASAQSVVSFALPIDSEAALRFISKEDWLGHCYDRKEIISKLYAIGDGLVTLLRRKGFDAVSVDINSNYRPEEGANNVTEMTEFHPDFSHRYAALASGIGRLGWSGNLMTPEFGSMVELGSVITSAQLECDPLLAKSPCDNCKMCALVCPVEMIDLKESMNVTVAGTTQKIARKRPNTCCWIGCTGYEGLAPGGEWSNWSPYRLDAPLPEDKVNLDALCISLQKADPQMHQEHNSFTDYRSFVLNPESFHYTVCGFCRSVCHADRDKRLVRRDRIHNSGVSALREDGMHVVATGNSVIENTPYLVNVNIEKSDSESFQKEEIASSSFNPLDHEVIAFLKNKK